MEKCAYRSRVEEYYRDNLTIPDDYFGCASCSGYPIDHGCPDYTPLSHVLEFYSYFDFERGPENYEK